jgi:hypothetical protein
MRRVKRLRTRKVLMTSSGELLPSGVNQLFKRMMVNRQGR